MFWIGLLIICPAWAIISAALVQQSGRALIKKGILLINIFGPILPTVVIFLETTINATYIFAGLYLLISGFYVVYSISSFGRSAPEITVYTLCFIIALLYGASDLASDLRKYWRFANVAGVLENQLLDEKTRHNWRNRLIAIVSPPTKTFFDR
jgi:hypothetical protein